MKTRILSVLAIAIFFISHSALATDPVPKKKQTIKVALLLDTSNSMDGLINQAKAQLWEIVNELSFAKYGIQKPDLKIALYEYGNSRLESADGYIRQVLSFSSDLDDISEKLFGLQTNGGQEYCGQVIATSLKELDWGNNKNDLRLIFIAGNEPFTQGTINYVESISDAKEKDILINTIFCGDYNQGISGKWQDGAQLGGGDYMTINHNKKVIHIVTPYDSEIIILNKKLNSTYIYYGKHGRASYEKQAKQDNNAKKLAQTVALKRAVTKSNRFYKNTKWDLVDAVEQDESVIHKIKKEELPESYRNKSKNEIKKIAKTQLAKRKEIQKKINELNKKRRVYIAAKQLESNKKDELESVMIKAIKRQAKLKNYSW
jgi:hypothetical protein